MLKKRRNRYLAVKIDCGEAFDSHEFIDAVWNAVLKLFGEHGASKSGLVLIDFDPENKLAVLRVTHTEVETLRAALATITRIQEKPAALHVLAISGTIKALYKKVKQ